MYTVKDFTFFVNIFALLCLLKKDFCKFLLKNADLYKIKVLYKFCKKGNRMRKGMKLFGVLLGFCLMPILGIVADGAGIPPPPPLQTVSSVKRFISQDLEKACSTWNYTEGKKVSLSPKATGNNMNALLANIKKGPNLKKRSNSDDSKERGPAKTLMEDLSRGVKKKKISLEFTRFLDEKADAERIDSILLAREALNRGYEVEIGGEKITIRSIPEYRLFQEMLQKKIKEMEESNESLLKPSQKQAEKLHQFVGQIINEDPGRTQDQIKRMKKEFYDEPNNTYSYPKTFKFFALVEEMQNQNIINQEQYDVFCKMRDFFEKERTFEKVQEVSRIKKLVEELRKAKGFKPEILKFVTSQEAEVIMQMDESDVRKVPVIIPPEDRATIRSLEYKIYAWQYVKEKVDQILTSLCEVAKATREKFRQDALETAEIQRYAKNVIAFCNALQLGDDPEENIKKLEACVKEKVDRGDLFDLENPTEQDKLDLRPKIAFILPTNVDLVSRYPEWSYEWVAQFFKIVLRNSNGNIVESYEKYMEAENAYVKSLKNKKQVFLLSPNAKKIIAQMGDLKEAIVRYGKTSVKWVSGLLFLIDCCEENIRALSYEKQELLKQQKSAVSRLKADIIKTKKGKLKTQDVSLFAKQITDLLDQRKKAIEATPNVPEGEPGVFKLIPNVGQFVPMAKRFEEAQTKIAQIQQALDKANVQADLLKELEAVKKERDFWKSMAEELQKGKQGLEARLKNKESELEQQKTGFKRALKNEKDKNQSLQSANQSLLSENTKLKNRLGRTGSGGTTTIYRENKEALNKALDELEEAQGSLGTKDRELDAKNGQIQALMNENSILQQKLKEAEDNNNKRRRNGSSFLSEEELMALEAQAMQLNEIKDEIFENARTLNQKEAELKKREEKVKSEEKVLQIEKGKAVMNGEKLKPGAVKIGNNEKVVVSKQSSESSSVVPTKVNKSTVQPVRPPAVQQPIVPIATPLKVQNRSNKSVVEPSRVGNKLQIPQSRTAYLRRMQNVR